MNCDINILINNTYFFNPEPSQFLSIASTKNLTIVNTQFESRDYIFSSINYNAATYVSALKLADVSNLTLVNSKF